MLRKHSEYLDRAIELLFFALLFCAPLFFDRSIGIVFSLSKATLIRSLTVLIMAVWLTKVFLGQGAILKRTGSDIPVLTYLLSCTAATLLSINVYVSFVGSYGRYEGLITLVNYTVLFFIAATVINSVGMLKKMMVCAVTSGALMAAYGMIQRMGLDPFVWGGVITNERVISTIGQPNFLAAYLDMAFMLGLGLILFSEKQHVRFYEFLQVTKKGKTAKTITKNPKRKN